MDETRVAAISSMKPYRFSDEAIEQLEVLATAFTKRGLPVAARLNRTLIKALKQGERFMLPTGGLLLESQGLPVIGLQPFSALVAVAEFSGEYNESAATVPSFKNIALAIALQSPLGLEVAALIGHKPKLQPHDGAFMLSVNHIGGKWLPMSGVLFMPYGAEGMALTAAEQEGLQEDIEQTSAHELTTGRHLASPVEVSSASLYLYGDYGVATVRESLAARPNLTKKAVLQSTLADMGTEVVALAQLSAVLRSPDAMALPVGTTKVGAKDVPYSAIHVQGAERFGLSANYLAGRYEPRRIGAKNQNRPSIR